MKLLNRETVDLVDAKAILQINEKTKKRFHPFNQNQKKMTTNQKNQWIALEVRYQQLEKEKNNAEHSGILSQLTFSTDGVIIRKYSELGNQGGISVQTYKKT